MATDEHLPEHHVAVTVFASVRAIDRLDAGNVAEIAVRQALAGSVWTGGPVTIEFRSNTATVPVTVHLVPETARAARNGYLTVDVTPVASTRRRHPVTSEQTATPDPAPAVWWSPSLAVLVGRHRYGGWYDVIEADDTGWSVTATQPVLPADAVRLVPATTPADNTFADLLRYLLTQYDAVVQVHAKVVMDTPEDRELHARAVRQFEEAAQPVRAALARHTEETTDG